MTMRTTRHALARMSQRGIPGDVVRFVLEQGRWIGDKCVITRKEADVQLQRWKRRIRKERWAEAPHEVTVLRRIIDKGGVVVVASGQHILTTYNLDSAWGPGCLAS